MKTVQLPHAPRVPALGLGTWRMGEHASVRTEELATIRLALELGVTLIDTAEMYGDGRAEELIGEALGSRRDEAFLVSKVYPHNASRRGAVAACDRSLRRLKTDHLDLYLLHWRGDIPLAETMEAFLDLQRAGKIRAYGVSNLDLKDMKELWQVPGGDATATDQVLYNLTRRGVEWDLVPWLRQHHVPVMAYSPIEQARLLNDHKLLAFARKYEMTPAQAALSWLLAHDDVMVIPKTSRRERLRENVGALEHSLNRGQLAELDQLFPPPSGPQGLEML
jgi:diketogulonate reductase-like aldo/keto reductase